MPNVIQLNNVEHKDLRVITAHGARYCDDVMAALTFPAEFRSVQAHYPIVFSRANDGTYTPLAVFGFKDRQNLFLTGEPGHERWDASYVPLMMERMPFYVGNAPNGKSIHIDIDSPRVSRTEGEPVFLEHGGNTEYLDKAISMLATIDRGIAATAPFVAALQEHDLLESFVIDITLRDGSQNRFAGFHTVQEERLAKLGAEALGKLHEKGYLHAIYMVVASLSHFRDLIERVGRQASTTSA